MILLAKNTVDNMNGHDFERWCADLLRRSGFSNVTVTPGSGDQGVDVLANKDGKKYAIQCKRYSSKLGNTPVQEVYTGKAVYNCQVAVVMTNNYFTAGAVAAAKATGVLLWDRDTLVKMSRQVPAGRSVHTQPAKPTTEQNQVQAKKEVPGFSAVVKAAFMILGLILSLIIVFRHTAHTKSSPNKNAGLDSQAEQFMEQSIEQPIDIVEENQNREPETPKSEDSIWPSQYTPINEFDYSIDDTGITIKRYKGAKNSVWIAPDYEIGGTSYPVAMIDGSISLSSGAKSIVISEGISKFSTSIFNFSDFEYIYIPSTLDTALRARDAISFLHKNADVYFGGTKEDWGTDYDPDSNKNIHVYYNCSFENGSIIKN